MSNIAITKVQLYLESSLEELEKLLSNVENYELVHGEYEMLIEQRVHMSAYLDVIERRIELSGCST